ncbi:MAG: 4Fe-4S dicluster domain-containing protein [Anaerolineales bacterium]|nr:4Fe-4S dicluster domain-containing protein [Anaerolineales bacterium]
MSHRVNPDVLTELQQYGAKNIEACFNCGNCTAVCPLTKEDESFPRKMIRYAQVGMADEMLGSKELWLCYNCGECSETCPRQADPSTFMMAARCYAVTHFDVFKFGSFLCKRPALGSFLVVLLALILTLFMYTQTQPVTDDSLRLFEFLPYHVVHDFGVALIVVIALAGLAGIFNMLRRMNEANGLTWRSFFRTPIKDWISALWKAIVVEALGQKRYRTEFQERDEHPWYLKRWFVHASTMWGFLGLALATALNYLLDIVGLKPTGTFVPIWYPIRLLGTISGIVFLYGATILMFRRWRKEGKAHSNSRAADWMFLGLLWLAGFSGFIVEISLYLPEALWGRWMLLAHVGISMELLLLLPFTKFAHAIYRTAALFMHELKLAPEEVPAGAAVPAD